MPAADDGLKWFGEGFDGFPKVLPEDSIEYSVYIINSDLKDSEVRERLRNVKKDAVEILRHLAKDVLWQRDPFILELESEAGRSFLRGRTNFGDSTDDEWLILYILRELSLKCPDAWIRAVDSDGEFLLIEAADVLPIWLNPEVADFRVWIHGGQLLLLPLDKPPERGQIDGSTDQLTLEQALGWIADPQRSLQHSSRIEAEAFTRLRQYPAQIANSQHTALITIPRRLAYILHDHPKSVTAAVEAFYLRDPISLKRITQKDMSDLLFKPDDLVTVSIKFTRIGYAQLKAQRFEAPKPWREEINKAQEQTNQSRIDIGTKLAVGYEILLSDKQYEDRAVVQESKMLLDDLTSGDVSLPSDEDISHWGLRQDDESWLDINFDDFDRELAGKSGAAEGPKGTGFGDQAAHAKLQRTVQKFEKFLAQEAEAGSLDLIDEMDHDNDEDVSDDDVTISEHSSDSGTSASKEPLSGKQEPVSEDDFTAMMRELMGMPADVMKEMMEGMNDEGQAQPQQSTAPNAGTSHDSIAKPNDLDIAMAQTELELRNAGVLNG